MTALPSVPEVTVIVPRPLVGDEETEYVALNRHAEFGPLGRRCLPRRSYCHGVAPSAASSPEKTVTPNAAGLVVNPAYVPLRLGCQRFVRNGEPQAAGSFTIAR